MDCTKHSGNSRVQLLNSVAIHSFSYRSLLEREWDGDPTKLNSMRSVNELALTSSVSGEYGRILESTSSRRELNGKESIEDTLRSSNMGRHATIAATSPMTKSNALITDDDAMSNALSTGEGEEESITLSFLVSSLIFSLLSSDASFLNLYLKRGSTNSYREESMPCRSSKAETAVPLLVSHSPLHIRSTVEVVRWILVRHDMVSCNLSSEAHPLSKLPRAGWLVDYDCCGHDIDGRTRS
jgi:hypothetical protein